MVVLIRHFFRKQAPRKLPKIRRTPLIFNDFAVFYLRRTRFAENVRGGGPTRGFFQNFPNFRDAA